MGGMGPWGGRFQPWWGTMWRFGSLFGTLLRVGLLALGMLVVAALGSRYVESIGNHTMADPLRSGLTGLLAEVLSIPLLVITCVVLAISIVGIPLLILVPFAIVLALVLMLVGFTGVAHHTGQLLTKRFGFERGIYGNVLLGLLAIASVTIVARLVGLLGGFVFGGFITGLLTFVGYMVEYAAWTVGAGAVILTWLNMRRNKTLSGGAAATSGPGLNEVPAQ
jgi:hypothetical protein